MRTYSFEELDRSILAGFAELRHESVQPTEWELLERAQIGEKEARAIEMIVERLRDYKTQRVNGATLWARAIYPLLALAERDNLRAWSSIPFAARFGDVEFRGEVDGAIADSIHEEVGLPHFVVVAAKRGIGARDPMAQLLGAMLCAARLNQQSGRPANEMYGCYTVGDVWTFLRGKIDWSGEKPVMSLLSSREYWEKTEARAILAILESIVAKAVL